MSRPHWDYSWQPPVEPPGTWDTAEIAGCSDDCDMCLKVDKDSVLYNISDIEGRPE